MATIAKRLGFGIAFCAAYLFLRHISFDQWFLPAGLRAACYLFMPVRYWPYLLAGDVAAMLTTRAPKADDYGTLWAYASSFFLPGLVCLVLLQIRKKLTSIDAIIKWLPLVAAFFAVWSSSSNIALNYFLSGPASQLDIESFARYVVGDFLGVLMIILPFLAWRKRKQGAPSSRNYWLDTSLCTASILGIHLTISINSGIGDNIKLLLLMLSIIPCVFLTAAHGWKGAAISIIVVNIAIAQTLDYTGIPENHDGTVFLAQQALAIAACTLLTFGHRVSALYASARKAGFAQQEAIKIAKMSFVHTEPALRELLIHMAQLQLILDEDRQDLFDTMRSAGMHEAAMALNARAAERRQLFGDQALALYPILIEEKGLFAVVNSEEFAQRWGFGAEVIVGFQGRPKDLGIDLQLAAYRCLCHAMMMYSECDPEYFSVSLRTAFGRHRCGILLSVKAKPTREQHITEATRTADALMTARIKAHGGRISRHAHGVRILLWEPSTTVQHQ